MSDPTAGEPGERLAEVYREILARAPEHDLVPSLDRVAAVVDLLGDPQTRVRRRPSDRDQREDLDGPDGGTPAA